jgi:hypothetical protein
MNKSAQDSYDTIGEFLEEVPSVKSAEANTEAGGHEGGTSHPVKDVDDRTEPADEGERSAENTSDVKSDDTGQGGASVDATPEASAKVGADEGTAAEDHQEATTNVQATGDDPANETNSAKPGKDDGGYEEGSSHPARTDNDELDGHKYARDLEGMSLEKLGEAMQDLGNDICATIATSMNDQTAGQTRKSAAEKCPGCDMPKSLCNCGSKEGAAAPAPNAQLAQQFGYEMAGLITGNLDKEAGEKLVDDTLVDIIKEASASADRTADWLDHQNKLAMEGDESDLENAGNDDGEGDGPPTANEGEEEAGDELAAMLGGEAGGAPGEEMGAGMGAGMGAEMGGLPPELAAAGGAPGAGGGDEEMLATVMEELGVTPQEFIAAMEAEAAGGLPGAGGAPGGPPIPGGAPGGMEVAASDRNASMRTHCHSIMKKSASAPLKGSDVQKAAAYSSYISEVVGRSRAKAAANRAAAEA